jgi:hypothetical protein
MVIIDNAKDIRSEGIQLTKDVSFLCNEIVRVTDGIKGSNEFDILGIRSIISGLTENINSTLSEKLVCLKEVDNVLS